MRPTIPAPSSDPSGAEITRRAPPVHDLNKGLDGTIADIRAMAMRCRLNADLGLDVSFKPDEAGALAWLLETLADIYDESKSPEKSPEGGADGG